jgi:tetratricopeptide (TPR) repeat protein
MPVLKKIALVLFALLPLAAGLLIPMGTNAFALSEASRQAANSKAASNRKLEINALDKVVTFQPWNNSAWSRLGELNLEIGETALALEDFSRSAEIAPLEPHIQFEFAKAMQTSGEIDQAKKLYRQLSETKISDASLLLDIAEAQKSINDSIGTLATLLRAKELSPFDEAINYALGIQFAATQPDNAVTFLQQASKQSSYQRSASSLIQLIQATQSISGSAERFIYIGQSLSNLGEWEAAAQAFDQARTVDPQNGIAWALHGETIQHLGESGYSDLSKALELDPHSDIVNGLMAVYYRRQQKFDLAIKYLYSASESNPMSQPGKLKWKHACHGRPTCRRSDPFSVATLMDETNWVPGESWHCFVFPTIIWWIAWASMQPERHCY